MIYLNEFDRHAAAWLRELSKERLIPEGFVDERSIKEVEAKDLEAYSQCHFFAGIGGWSEALRIAGWPESVPVWTGSCPCQPFSQAGKRKGTDDERHLWPEFRRLIAERRPATIFGEQVASRDGREWLAGVRVDLEALGYAVGCADLCAAGVGAPHIRQRLYWVADKQGERRTRMEPEREPEIGERSWARSDRSACRMANADGRIEGDRDIQRGRQHGQQPEDGGACGGMGNANRAELGEQCGAVSVSPELAGVGLPSNAGYWDRFDLIPCRDGKARRVESGSFPLVDGVPGRVGLLRGFGNAIVPQVAAMFIKAFLQTMNEKQGIDSPDQRLKDGN